MRSYHEPIDVRRGLVSGQEAPEQFLWRGRLWVVREVIAHWIETGAWWDQPGVSALLGVGSGGAGGGASGSTPAGAGPRGADLLGEREFWRVEASRGWSFSPPARSTGEDGGQAEGDARHRDGDGGQAEGDARHVEQGTEGHGVFDLVFDWGGGQWQLAHSID